MVRDDATVRRAPDFRFPGAVVLTVTPGQSREFILGHVRAGKDVFRSEIEEAGFRFESEVDIPTFQENYMLRFRRE